jgi:hypothetical protein
MRFILPGLPALAAAMCGAWPTPVIWGLAAFQIFGAMNYSTGWISELRIPLPLHSIAILPSNAPAAEDWRLDEILRAAQAQAEPGRPVANLTLIANAPYFNGPTFTWEAKRLKLPTLHIRGVNKRLCEFSEFVLLKDSNLGPDGVTEGLPEAAAIVRSSTTWFSRGYEKAGTWPLPDGSNAVLYKQRRLPGPPFRTNGVQFMFYTSGPFTGNDFRVQMEPWDKTAAEYPSAKATASSIELRGIKIARPSVTFDHAVFIPASEDRKAPEWDEIRFLKVGRLKIDSAEVAGDDLRAYIEGRVKGLKFDKFSLDKTLSATGRVGPFAFAVELGVELLDSPKRLKATILQARHGATALPAGLLGGYREFTFPLQPSPETPFDIELAGLTLRDGKLTIP